MAAAVTSGPIRSPGRTAMRARRPKSDPVPVARCVGGRGLFAEDARHGRLRARRGALHRAPEVEEVGVAYDFLPVRERDHPLVELVQLEARGLDPEGGAAILQRVTAGVLAQNERRLRDTDVLRTHDLVRPAVLEDAVLVDAGFVREGVP